MAVPSLPIMDARLGGAAITVNFNWAAGCCPRGQVGGWADTTATKFPPARRAMTVKLPCVFVGDGGNDGLERSVPTIRALPRLGMRDEPERLSWSFSADNRRGNRVESAGKRGAKARRCRRRPLDDRRDLAQGDTVLEYPLSGRAESVLGLHARLTSFDVTSMEEFWDLSSQVNVPKLTETDPLKTLPRGDLVI